MKKYSIKEIAQLSGVSVATVSRVINNNGRFSEETKKKVLAVINETGYQTNYSAKSLRMNKSYTIGIIVPDITNYFFAKLIELIEGLLFEKGYSTIICNTARDMDKENSYLNILESKGVDGLIIISGSTKFSFHPSDKNIPYVCIDREPANLADTIFISSDHYDGAVKATNYLFEQGCTHPVIITYERKSNSGDERLNGFIQTLKEKGYSFDFAKNHLTLDSESHDELDKVLNFLKNNPKSDGFFAMNDNLAIKFQNILLSLNQRENYKLIGFDDKPEVQHVRPQISSIHQNIEQIAEVSVKQMLNLLDNKSVTSLGKTYKIPVTLVER